VIWVRRILAFLTLAPIAAWRQQHRGRLDAGNPWPGGSIDEGSVHSCTISGTNVGELWPIPLACSPPGGPVFFLPLVLGAGILWAIVAIVARIRAKR